MPAKGAGWANVFRKKHVGFVLSIGRRRYWNGQVDESLGYDSWFTASPRKARLFKTRAEAYAAAANAEYLQSARPEEHWE